MDTQESTPTDGFSLAKIGEFTSSLFDIYGGYRQSEAEADKFKYMAQVEAMRSQLNETEYEAQNLPETTYAAGIELPGGKYLLLGLAGLVVFVVARKL